jgi:hypothetical protein
MLKDVPTFSILEMEKVESFFRRWGFQVRPYRGHGFGFARVIETNHLRLPDVGNKPGKR